MSLNFDRSSILTFLKTAYIIYCFPSHAVAVGALLGFFRDIVLFTSQFYAADWITGFGLYTCFAIQTSIMILCAILAATVQRWGESWRHSFPWDGQHKRPEVPTPTEAEQEAQGGLATGVWDEDGARPQIVPGAWR